MGLMSTGMGPRVSLWTLEGKRIARVGDASRGRASQFTSPHGVAVDSRGDIYAGLTVDRSVDKFVRKA